MSSSEIPVGLRATHAGDVVLIVEARTLDNQLKEAHVDMVAPPAEAVTIRYDFALNGEKIELERE